MTTRLIASSLAEPQKISVNTTFSKPLDSTGPFYVQPGLTSKNVLATVNLKSIGDAAAAKTTLILPGASSDYIFKSAGRAVIISSNVGTKVIDIASLDLTTVANGYNTPSVQFTDVTAKFHYVTAIKKTAASPAVPAYLELNSLLLSEDKGSSATDGISNSGKISSLSSTTKSTFSYSVDGGKTYTPMTGTSVDLPAKDYAVGSIKIIEISASKIINATTNAKTITVDKTAPAVPVIKLDSDTGISATDGITKVATVNVTGLEVGATWQYSVNGANFVDGTGTSFNLPEDVEDGQFAAGKILVKQTDVAGNVSATASLGAVTLDTTADDLSIALAEDTGTSAIDSITKVGTVNVTGLEDGATWQYRIKAGDFVNGTGTSFDLPEDDTYNIGDILVRQVDKAGNASEVESKNTMDWTLDSTANDLSIALAEDTGISVADGITNIATVNVSGLEDGATWQYSIDGIEFVDGMGTSFTLPEDGEFAAGKVLVMQTDVAGNISATAYLDAVTLDTKADDLSITLAEDAGISANDGITKVATVNITGLEVDATWQYSVNGASYVDGTGTSFELPADMTYDKGDILVRQTDVAGNESDVEATNSEDWTLDRIAPVNPVFDKIAVDNIIDKAEKAAGVTITGTTEADSTVAISLNGSTTTAQATVTAGKWSYTLPADNIVEGLAIKVTAVSTDKAGNASAAVDQNVIVAVNVDANGTNDAATGSLVYIVTPNDFYTYTIANLTSNDQLQFPTGGSLSIVQDSFKDNFAILEFVTSDGKGVDIKLTGLTDAQDLALSSPDYKVLNALLGSDVVSVNKINAISTGNAVILDGNFAQPSNATTADITYTINASNSESLNIIDGFGLGDKLEFPAGGSKELQQDSVKDGFIVIEYVASNNNIVEVKLTGLTDVQDAALSTIADFNLMFGTGAIV